MVMEYRVVWTGFIGAPGVSVFHGRPSLGTLDPIAAQDFADGVNLLMQGMAGLLPDDVVLTYDGEVTKLNTTTGILEDVYAVTAGTPTTGASTGSYAAPAGARTEWGTDAIVAGRRLRGRTYWVPMPTGNYQTDGTLTSAVIDAMRGYAEIYRDDNDGGYAPCVWSRTHGILADITSVVIPDQVSVLRSRRD